MKSHVIPGRALFAAGLIQIGCAMSHAVPVLRNSTAELRFTGDLRGVASLIDLQTGREMSATVATDLYVIAVGRDYAGETELRASDASSATGSQIEHGWELRYRHDGAIPLVVVCRVTSRPDDTLMHWTLEVENLSGQPIASIGYPQIACVPRLSADSADDAVLFPVNEGVLLTGLPGSGAKKAGRYPGNISAQLLYYFDAKGGLYYAAHDGNGHPKDFSVHHGGPSLVLSQKLVLPIARQDRVALPYEVVTGCFGGRWEAGAGVYRTWSDHQSWTAKKIRDRDTPAWLKQPVLFINSNLTDSYPTVEAADRMIVSYREYFGAPIVTVVFGWEKHGAWIGPDYFPARPGEDYYRELARCLAARGDRLHVYTSGFRWGVRKPVDESGREPRVYTGYDGRADFETHGRALAAVEPDGKPAFKQPRWADNFLLCTGSQGARNLLAECYQHLCDLGIAGVDLDQNLGGEVEDCFDPAHGHPLGAGLWQTHAMEEFFSDIAAAHVRPDGDFFQGVEEASERYIPWLDVHHGRAFTGTAWPVSGPGAVSVPLYLFLYHQYQISYAGWIDYGFSPAGVIKYGIGRAFIFGMYPGVRVNGETLLDPASPSSELRMLRGAMRLIQAAPEFLLRGRMTGELEINGSSPLDTSAGRGEKLPRPWNAVQGIGWQSEDGTGFAAALTNLSGKVQHVRVRLPDGMAAACTPRGYANGHPVRHPAVDARQGSLELSLQPWEVLLVLNPPGR